MTFIFPDLPAPRLGHTLTSADRAGRTRMAGGNIKARIVMGRVPNLHDAIWTLTADERATFYAFAAQVRAEKFTIPLPMPGSGLRPVTARFIAPPSAPIGWSALGSTVSEVRARLAVDDVEIVGDMDVLVASDGSGDPLTDSAGDGDPLIWEELF